MYDILVQEREPISDEMAPPAEDISGHWEVDVEFFTSTSKHKFFLEQDGNWVSGTHTSEYAMQEVVGMIEGNEVVLRSNYRVPGNSVNFWFIGKISQGNLSGSVFLGEYLTAEFTAKGLSYKHGRKKFLVPGGPPLAT